MDLAIVTGASRGLGYDLTRQLLERGFAVAAIVRPGSVAPEGATEIPWDLDSPESIPEDRLSGLLNARPDRLLVILNAAILGRLGPVSSSSLESLEGATRVNVLSPGRLASWAIDATEQGPIPLQLVLVSSGAGRHPIPDWGVYCTTKAAAEMLFRCIGADHPRVRVDVVDPGVMRTRMQEEIHGHRGEDVPATMPSSSVAAERLLHSIDAD